MSKEVVSAQKVLEPLGHTKVKPTFVQWAGLWLAAGVGALIIIVTLCLLAFLWSHYPTLPPESSIKSGQSDIASAIDQYKSLSEIIIKDSTTVFQTIVTQALLPVFTAILGYIFGRGGKE